MRVMVRFRFPTEEGNDILRSGKINTTLQRIMEDFKPEAAYFYADEGLRAGHFVVNMTDSTDVLRFGEPLWFGLGGEVEMTPVMAPEDIQRALGELPGIVDRFG